jgi:ribonuclease HI
MDGLKCGAGGIIKIPNLLVYKWLFNYGRGTNNRAKLLGVWASLRLALHLSFLRLQILRDSKVIIDWLNDRARLQSSSKEGWKDRIKDFIKSFQDISFEHFYKEFNIEANNLSKMVLQEPIAMITYSQWTNGVEGPKCFLRLY